MVNLNNILSSLTETTGMIFSSEFNTEQVIYELANSNTSNLFLAPDLKYYLNNLSDIIKSQKIDITIHGYSIHLFW